VFIASFMCCLAGEGCEYHTLISFLLFPWWWFRISSFHRLIFSECVDLVRISNSWSTIQEC